MLLLPACMSSCIIGIEFKQDEAGCIQKFMNSIREIGENIKNSPHFKGGLRYGEELAPHTTMRVGGAAAVFAEPEDALSAALVIQMTLAAGARLLVLGGGSNLVVSDAGYDGVVLSTSRLGGIGHTLGGLVALDEPELAEHGLFEGRRAVLHCGAGVSFDSICAYCAEHGLWGLSFFSGLPGSAGGAAFMNARCYGKEASDVLLDAAYINIEEFCINGAFEVDDFQKIYHNEKSDWSYKHSPFMEKYALVTSVDFSCIAVESGRVRELIQSKNDFYVQDRKSKGHFSAPSAGSVFKNNRAFGKPSGQLIDEAGLKGVVHGGAQVAPWHGNFIINQGHATAADIKELVEIVRQKVLQKTGFGLETEIIFV